MRRYVCNSYLQYLIQHLLNLSNSLLMRCPRVTYEYLLRFIPTRECRRTIPFFKRKFMVTHFQCAEITLTVNFDMLQWSDMLGHFARSSNLVCFFFFFLLSDLAHQNNVVQAKWNFT